ncbi:MAG TPA: YqeG family HAD IIIA-type phosphatase [Thermoguttaceae bacterium]|nr:YqeG family HAD IIIA-type phosphatase [Thermoguttaceae bacterium]
MFRFLLPHLRVASVCDLSLDRLRELELQSLLLDVDCTLKRYRDERVLPEVAAWLEDLRSGGVGLCLVSNGLGRRIARFAEQLDLPFVANALKPFPFGLRRAVRQMDFQRSRTAMVGDQLFADVIAGRLAGLTSILVQPIHPEEEPWFTRLKRPAERFLLRRLGKGVTFPPAGKRDSG